MTLSETRDDFQRRYARECVKRNIAPVIIQEGSMAQDIAEAQQDIQRRLSVVQSYSSITTESGSNTYDLPTNFGSVKSVMIEGLKLTEWSFNDVISSQDSEGTPNYFTIYPSGNTNQIILHNTPDKAYTVYVYYYVDLGYYSPSGDAVQNWGKFDNNYFYGSPALPERYSRAVVYGMLSNWFVEFEAKYENELRSLRESRVSSLPTRKYSMGGYKQASTQMTVIVEGSTTTTTTTTGSSNDNPSKFLYFEYDYTTGVVTIDSDKTVGYVGTITGSSSGGVITISNSSPEFSINHLFIDPNNDDTIFSNTSSSITLTPPSNKHISCKVFEY